MIMPKWANPRDVHTTIRVNITQNAIAFRIIESSFPAETIDTHAWYKNAPVVCAAVQYHAAKVIDQQNPVGRSRENTHSPGRIFHEKLRGCIIYGYWPVSEPIISGWGMSVKKN
jgi:hypothetical protein